MFTKQINTLLHKGGDKMGKVYTGMHTRRLYKYLSKHLFEMENCYHGSMHRRGHFVDSRYTLYCECRWIEIWNWWSVLSDFSGSILARAFFVSSRAAITYRHHFWTSRVIKASCTDITNQKQIKILTHTLVIITQIHPPIHSLLNSIVFFSLLFLSVLTHIPQEPRSPNQRR